MNIRDFAVIIVRFFGLWLLFQCIGMAERAIPISMIAFSNQGPAYGPFNPFASIFNVVLYVVLGVILVWKPQIVADRLPPQGAKDSKIRVTTTNLMFLCFSVAGLVFFVDGLKGLLHHTATYLFTPKGPSYIGRYGQTDILPAAFETVVGLWLLFGFKWIVRSLRRMWPAGRTPGTSQSHAGTNEDRDRR